jgi:hypothetical protein
VSSLFGLFDSFAKMKKIRLLLLLYAICTVFLFSYYFANVEEKTEPIKVSLCWIQIELNMIQWSGISTQSGVNLREGGSKRLFIAIATSHSEKSFRLRHAIRNTWMTLDHKWRDQFTYRFFVGLPSSTASMNNKRLNWRLNVSSVTFINRDIDRVIDYTESSSYGDIVQLSSFLDTYQNLSIKTMRICEWVHQHYDATLMIKMDDDVYVRLDMVVNSLESIVPYQYLLINVIHLLIIAKVFWRHGK